ncbi:MAG: ATP synthase F1 subunit epsilon [Bacteroidia bacterium]
MFLEIITPDKKLFSGEVKSILLPGTDGKFGILDKHAPIISSLKTGTLKIVDAEEQKQTFEIKGGVVEMLDNKVIILAE